MEGYSGTPLAKKLGIKEGDATFFVNVPDHYFDLFLDFPLETLRKENPEPRSVDFIHLFCESQEILSNHAPKLKEFLKLNGMFWISWPKGTSKIDTDLNRELVRAYVLEELGLVDVKVAAVDKDWSGLKFVYRIKDRV